MEPWFAALARPTAAVPSAAALARCGGPRGEDWNGPHGPGFNQPFIGEISADGKTIAGRWERGLGTLAMSGRSTPDQLLPQVAQHANRVRYDRVIEILAPTLQLLPTVGIGTGQHHPPRRSPDAPTSRGAR